MAVLETQLERDITRKWFQEWISRTAVPRRQAKPLGVRPRFLKTLVFKNRIMPRRELLTSTQREELLAFPTDETDLLRYYTFNTHDLAVIRRRRGDHNRLGFAVQLCYVSFPGRLLAVDEPPYAPILAMAR
jgi:Domain of unknown function (DUF4158)